MPGATLRALHQKVGNQMHIIKLPTFFFFILNIFTYLCRNNPNSPECDGSGKN